MFPNFCLGKQSCFHTQVYQCCFSKSNLNSKRPRDKRRQGAERMQDDVGHIKLLT